MQNAIFWIFNFLVITCRLPIQKSVKFDMGKKSRLVNCDAHSIHGRYNIICVGDKSKLSGCKFVFKGNNNVIRIGNNCQLSKTTFWISGNGNCIEIGNKTTVGNNCQFATLEGTNIKIGEDCMFSHDIYVRTSDSHSILDKDNNRINQSQSISIGNHVWVGLQALILKGSEISDNSVVAARAIVSKKFNEEGCLLVGAPAKIIKEEINWSREKL